MSSSDHLLKSTYLPVQINTGRIVDVSVAVVTGPDLLRSVVHHCHLRLEPVRLHHLHTRYNRHIHSHRYARETPIIFVNFLTVWKQNIIGICVTTGGWSVVRGVCRRWSDSGTLDRHHSDRHPHHWLVHPGSNRWAPWRCRLSSCEPLALMVELCVYWGFCLFRWRNRFLCC